MLISSITDSVKPPFFLSPSAAHVPVFASVAFADGPVLAFLFSSPTPLFHVRQPAVATAVKTTGKVELESK